VKMTKRKDLFQLIGELSVSFSSLEHMLGYILCELVSLNEPFVGGLVTAEAPLHRKLRLIRKLASYRLLNAPDLRKEVLDLVEASDKLRPDRNLWVHGNWELSEEQLMADKVRCFDFRWEHREHSGGGEFVGVREREFTIEQLNQLRSEVQRCAIHALRLVQTVRAAPLLQAKQPL